MFSMGGILYVIVVYSLRTVYVIAIGPVRNRGGRVGNTGETAIPSFEVTVSFIHRSHLEM